MRHALDAAGLADFSFSLNREATGASGIYESRTNDRWEKARPAVARALRGGLGDDRVRVHFSRAFSLTIPPEEWATAEAAVDARQ